MSKPSEELRGLFLCLKGIYMIVIRTAEDMARALESPLEPDLIECLHGHRDRLSEWSDYDFSDLAMFVIAQPGDTLTDIAAACGWKLVKDGSFTQPVELIARHGGWIEATFILSDDGFGWVLLVSTAATSAHELLAVCNQLISQQEPGV